MKLGEAVCHILINGIVEKEGVLHNKHLAKVLQCYHGNVIGETVI